MKRRENINLQENMSTETVPVLVCTNTSQQSTRDIYIDKDEFKIGRARENDEVIAHVAISRQHCIFHRKENGNWVIEDVSSSGTLVNGTPLGHGQSRTIAVGDFIQFSLSNEFSYTFVLSLKGEPLAKRPRLAEPTDLNDIVTKQKTFEESQQMERRDLAEKMKAKQTEQIELERELQKLLSDRDAALGEKDHLNKQIHSLEQNIEEVKLAEMNLERLNLELSTRLDKERQEFERKLNEEKNKMQEALEISRREKELLETKMREQLEKLKNEQEVQCRKLTETLSEEKKAVQEKLQNEQIVFAEKLKQMSEALSRIEARAEELQTDLEKEKAAKAAEILVLDTVVETVEVSNNDLEQRILDTIDLTIDKPSEAKTTNAENAGVTTMDVYSKVGDIMDEQLTCSICSELFVTAITLNCTHTFCQYCINTWRKKKKECPVCRSAITAMNRSLVLDNFIDKMVENLSIEYKTRRMEIVEERRAEEKRANAPVNKGKGKRGRPRGGNNNNNGNDLGNSSNTTAASTSSAPSNNNNSIGERIAHSSHILRREPTQANNERYSSSSSSSQHDQSGTTSDYQSSSSGSSQQHNQVNVEISSSSGTDDDDTNPLRSSSTSSSSARSLDSDSADTAEQTRSRGNDWDDGSDRSNESSSSDLDGSESDYVEGVPGRLYGGYGVCYICGHRGHWSPGCPYR